MWGILKYLLTLVAIVGITAFVIAVYEIILAFHEEIMNENTNDHAQVSNTDDQRDESRSGGE